MSWQSWNFQCSRQVRNKFLVCRKRFPCLQADAIDNGTGSSRAGSASDKSASGGPAYASGVESEAKRQIVNGAADNDVVVAEQQAPESRNGRCNDERPLVRNSPAARSVRQDWLLSEDVLSMA